jgi:hypothetical protein
MDLIPKVPVFFKKVVGDKLWYVFYSREDAISNSSDTANEDQIVVEVSEKDGKITNFVIFEPVGDKSYDIYSIMTIGEFVIRLGDAINNNVLLADIVSLMPLKNGTFIQTDILVS